MTRSPHLNSTGKSPLKRNTKITNNPENEFLQQVKWNSNNRKCKHDIIDINDWGKDSIVSFSFKSSQIYEDMKQKSIESIFSLLAHDSDNKISYLKMKLDSKLIKKFQME